MNDIKNSARLIAHTLLSHAKENSELTDEMIFLVIDRVDISNRGNIIVWVNNKINQVIHYDPMDIVILK